MRFKRLTLVPEKGNSIINYALRSFIHSNPLPETGDVSIEKIAKIINEHPFPEQPLRPTLARHLPPSSLTNAFVENVLGRLFSSHSNGLKALEFFKFSLAHSAPSPDAFEKTLHVLARMRYFDHAWKLMRTVGRAHPSLLTLKSMGILISKIAKFGSFEDTLAAFDRMEKEIFAGRVFGTEEFNVLLRAFCAMRQMKEARSVFVRLLPRFRPNRKTMNILLLGFKETGNLSSVELFYHEMVSRGFKPDAVAFGVRIDAYCKSGGLADGLRLLWEMERSGFPATLATLTTLIHGAGIVRNRAKAREIFEGIGARNMVPDTAAYNAYLSALVRCRELVPAAALMDEMDARRVPHDNMTYHTLFLGMMRAGYFEGVYSLNDKMVSRGFIPEARTVVKLMKFFCENSRVDLGWRLWGYVVERGNCPHGHALELLLTGLCSRGLVAEAFLCSKQVLERGSRLSGPAFHMVERLLLRDGDLAKLTTLKEMAAKLQTHLPPLRERIS